MKPNEADRLMQFHATERRFPVRRETRALLGHLEFERDVDKRLSEQKVPVPRSKGHVMKQLPVTMLNCNSTGGRKVSWN